MLIFWIPLSIFIQANFNYCFRFINGSCINLVCNNYNISIFGYLLVLKGEHFVYSFLADSSRSVSSGASK